MASFFSFFAKNFKHEKCATLLTIEWLPVTKLEFVWEEWIQEKKMKNLLSKKMNFAASSPFDLFFSISQKKVSWNWKSITFNLAKDNKKRWRSIFHEKDKGRHEFPNLIFFFFWKNYDTLFLINLEYVNYVNVPELRSML